jgi:acetyl-CoA carboxylase biotin carboxyl carrier protein
MKMDLNYLKKLIKLLDTSDLAEIEIEEEGTKIKLSKPRPKIFHNVLNPQVAASTPILQIDSTNSTSNIPAPVKTDILIEETKSDNIYEVKSPMVGTFYSSPAPDADSYVKVGTEVKQGTVICIIEAMKLMNEIESEVKGKIVKILAQNAQAVEYNQTLFLIELSQ